MHVARVHFGCALSQHDRRVAVVGGQINRESGTDSCELYDLERDEWTEIAKLPKPLLSSSILVVDQKYNYRIGDKT